MKAKDWYVKVLDFHVRGVPAETVKAADSGRNVACVDCGRSSLAGGLRCLGCFRLKVRQRERLVPAPPYLLKEGPARCGTSSGYDRHRRNGEKPCRMCTEARAAYTQERKIARGEAA